MYDTLYSGGTSGLFVFSHKEQDFKFKIGTLFDIVTTSDDYRMKMQFETPLNNGDNYRYGAEFSQNILRYNMSGLYDPCNDDLEVCGPASTGTKITLKDKLTLDTTRIFNAYDWMATPYLQLTFGMNNVYDDYMKETTIEPRFQSRYELTDNWTLTGAVGRHTQTPRDFFAVLKETGNPELDMPNSEHYVTGFEYQLDDSVSAKLEVYYKDLHDLVISNPAYDEKTSPNEKKFLNAAEGHTYGVEFLVNKNLTDRWYGWASVTYSKTKRKNTITDESFNYSYDRPWIVNLVASYELTPKMTVGAKWRYQSGNLVTPISGGKAVYKCDSGYEADNTGAGCGSDPYLYDPIEGKINSERLSAVHSMDLRIDYQKSEMTNIYFDVKNIYGRQNITGYDYNDDYSTREKVSDLPSLFSLGAKFTF
jgi:outer membrane receptor for ferrienterochelin and colicin